MSEFVRQYPNLSDWLPLLAGITTFVFGYLFCWATGIGILKTDNEEDIDSEDMSSPLNPLAFAPPIPNPTPVAKTPPQRAKTLDEVKELVAVVDLSTSKPAPKASPFSWDKVLGPLESEIKKILKDQNASHFVKMSTGELSISPGKSTEPNEAVLLIKGTKNKFELAIRVADKVFLPSSDLPSFRKGHPLENWREVLPEIQKLLATARA